MRIVGHALASGTLRCNAVNFSDILTAGSQAADSVDATTACATGRSLCKGSPYLLRGVAGLVEIQQYVIDSERKVVG